MVDFIEFLRLFDQGRGSKWSIVLNFFDFLTFRPGEGLNRCMYWNFSTIRPGGRVLMVNFLEFFLLFDQWGGGGGGWKVGSGRRQKSMVRVLGTILLTLSKKMGIFFIFEVKMGKPLAKWPIKYAISQGKSPFVGNSPYIPPNLASPLNIKLRSENTKIP